MGRAFIVDCMVAWRVSPLSLLYANNATTVLTSSFHPVQPWHSTFWLNYLKIHQHWSFFSVWLRFQTFAVCTKWKMEEIQAYLLSGQWMSQFNVILSRIPKTTKPTSSIPHIHHYIWTRRIKTFKPLKTALSNQIVCKKGKYLNKFHEFQLKWIWIMF